ESGANDSMIPCMDNLLQITSKLPKNPLTEATLYLANLDKIIAFRYRHWNFTKEYIIKNTTHPVATGGSPIVTWLPNQLLTILEQMSQIYKTIDYSQLTPENKILIDELIAKANNKKRVLNGDVKILKEKFSPESQKR
ncbi:20902_t:CDS:2, partial [Dentiscutata erythropus]